MLRSNRRGHYFATRLTSISNRFTSMKNTSAIGTLLMIMLGIFVLCTLSYTKVSAQASEEPLWSQKLNCADQNQLYQGLEYCTYSEGDQDVHVVVIDLYDELGLRFENILAEGISNTSSEVAPCLDVNRRVKGVIGCDDPNDFPPPGSTLQDGTPITTYYPVMSLIKAAARVENNAVVVDTDYGAGTQALPDSREHGPEGLTIVDGHRIDGVLMDDGDNNAVCRPWVAIGENAPYRVLFGQLGNEPDHDPQRCRTEAAFLADDGNKPGQWMHTAFGGAPWLIRDGEKQQDEIDTCRGATLHSCTSDVAQTAVALDGRWLYFVVAVGVDANGIADFLYDNLQPTHAIKLDGGGSSQLWYGGSAATQNNSRNLSHYLAILAPAGNGIDWDQPGSEPPPTSESWWERITANLKEWWDETSTGIIQWLSNWWENTWNDAQQRFDDWWQRQKEDIGRRIEQGLVQALEQLCSGAAVPSTVVVFVWIQRRRRNSKD